MKTERRKIWLDVIRIVAILFVVFNHTGPMGFLLYTRTHGTNMYWLYMFASSLCRMAVSLFFMVSGALLLCKEENILNTIRKRTFKFFIILFCGSLFYYLLDVWMSKGYFDITFFIKEFYSEGIVGPYWYLYAYIVYTLMLPILRKVAKALENKEFIYAYLLLVISRLVSILEFVFGGNTIIHNQWLNIPIDNMILVYPLLGYFIENRIESGKFSRRNIVYALLFMILCVSLCCVVNDYSCDINNVWNYAAEEREYQLFLDTHVILTAPLMYFVVKGISGKIKWNNLFITIVTQAGSCTLGLYLLEKLCREKLVWIFNWSCPYILSMPAAMLWTLGTCMVGWTITYILKRIPVVNKVI